MGTRRLRIISRLAWGRLSEGKARSVSSLASRKSDIGPFSRRSTSNVMASNLFGFCIMIAQLAGCVKTLDEVIDKNEAPKANAGEDQTVDLVGEETTVTLDGSKSEDKDGKIVKYEWRGGDLTPLVSMDGGAGDGSDVNGNAGDTGGSTDGAVEQDSAIDEYEEDLDEVQELPKTPVPEEIATPQVSLGEGVHTFHLWVTDDDGATSVDRVVITVKRP